MYQSNVLGRRKGTSKFLHYICLEFCPTHSRRRHTKVHQLRRFRNQERHLAITAPSGRTAATSVKDTVGTAADSPFASGSFAFEERTFAVGVAFASTFATVEPSGWLASVAGPSFAFAFIATAAWLTFEPFAVVVS